MENIHPNLQTVLKIFLILTVLSITCAVFSKLNLIKWYLCFFLGQERFQNMLIFAIEKKACILDYSEIMEMVFEVKVRKKQDLKGTFIMIVIIGFHSLAYNKNYFTFGDFQI